MEQTVELLRPMDPTVTIGKIHHLIADGILDAVDSTVMETRSKKDGSLCFGLRPCKFLDKKKTVDGLMIALAKLPAEIIEAAQGRSGRPPGRLRLAAEWLKSMGDDWETVLLDSPQAVLGSNDAGVMPGAASVNRQTDGENGREGRLWRVQVPDTFKDVSDWRAHDSARFRKELDSALTKRVCVELATAATARVP